MVYLLERQRGRIGFVALSRATEALDCPHQRSIERDDTRPNAEPRLGKRTWLIAQSLAPARATSTPLSGLEREDDEFLAASQRECPRNQLVPWLRRWLVHEAPPQTDESKGLRRTFVNSAGGFVYA
jgi:hypothetical protein